MLFNSFEFLFAFLPLCLLGYSFFVHRFGNEAAIGWLVFSSLVFYSYWNPKYLALIVVSMLVNYWFGRKLGRVRHRGFLTIGIGANLGLLGYYKYAGFFLENFNFLFSQQWNIESIILPLAISFFTFQQIAYLIDSYKGITREYSFLHYALFVSFFPQLIAGPIVHHKEMLPQFESTARHHLRGLNASIGISIFAIGLFKKTVLADGIAVYANPVFAAADAGEPLTFFTAWGGAFCYTFQLYFDFSGYSDMAIGLARIFGVVLPLNFYSPYKSANISEFWRRWHMTLSRFLRDYVYIPLGGNRHGAARRYLNLILTMLLGGLWHGAGWNFVIWGALHGAYLSIHQLWVKWLGSIGFSKTASFPYVFLAWSITFVAVVIGWVFFRATTFDGAVNMLSAMSGTNGVSIPNALMVRLGEFGLTLQNLGVHSNAAGGTVFVLTWLWVVCMFPIVLLLPNTQDMFSSMQGSLSRLQFSGNGAFWPARARLLGTRWSLSKKWALTCALLMGLGLMTLTQVSEFLYFQF